jgi:hypothetical protein
MFTSQGVVYSENSGDWRLFMAIAHERNYIFPGGAFHIQLLFAPNIEVATQSVKMDGHEPIFVGPLRDIFRTYSADANGQGVKAFVYPEHEVQS